jgi:hypothetical protein
VTSGAEKNQLRRFASAYYFGTVIGSASAALAAWRCRLRFARFIIGHESRRSTSTRLLLEIDIRNGKVIGVADDVGHVAIFFDRPRWRKADAALSSLPAGAEMHSDQYKRQADEAHDSS